MQMDPTTLGICKSASCVAAGNGPVERYAGPGQFCPDCGELLQQYVPGKSAWSLPESPAPLAPQPQLQAPPQPQPPPQLRPQPASSSLPKPRDNGVTPFSFRSHPHALGASLLVAGGAVMLFAVLRTMAVGHSGVPGTVGVCGSSMTERIARDVLHGYGTRNRALADHFEVRTSNCNVRFAIDMNEGRRRPGGWAGPASAGHRERASEPLGHDGVVAIVNPQNPVGQMSTAELRKIVAGELTDWTSVGGRSEPIVVYLPEDLTDEAHIVSVALMQGIPAGKLVVRVPSSTDAVRAVTAANGRNSIGLVAFSAAVPGKVLTLQEFPAPSVLSIGDRRYPLTVALTIESSDVQRDATVSGLVSYAGSDDARAIAERAGVVTKRATRP